MFEIGPRNPGLVARMDIVFWWWRHDEILISPEDLVLGALSKLRYSFAVHSC